MNDKYILVDGEPVVEPDLMTWAAWFESNQKFKHVADNYLGDIRISTVFLSLDHQFGEGPPILYETMIFGGEHDEYQERYSTRSEAVQGHAKALALVRRSLS